MFKPKACKKVISGNLNIAGINSFHNHIIGNENNTLIITDTQSVIKNNNNLVIIFYFC